MTNETKQWLLATGWKHFTLTQLSEKTNETTTTLIALFKQHDIKPMTHRDIVTSKLLDVYNSPECKCVDDAAILCGCSTKLITEINEEWQLGIPSKMEYKKQQQAQLEKIKNLKTQPIPLTSDVRQAINNIIGNDNRIERAAGVYTQSGSEILDNLRGVQTTNRPETLLTNCKSK